MKRLLALALLALSCQLPAPADDPDLITNLRFSPSAFDSFRHNTEIRYTLKHPVRLSVVIVHRDSSGAESIVTTLASDIPETSGTHAHTWLGETMQGAFAPAGRYLGRVLVDRRTFETAVLIYH
jgi:hypothetical protein